MLVRHFVRESRLPYTPEYVQNALLAACFGVDGQPTLNVVNEGSLVLSVAYPKRGRAVDVAMGRIIAVVDSLIAAHAHMGSSAP